MVSFLAALCLWPAVTWASTWPTQLLSLGLTAPDCSRHSSPVHMETICIPLQSPPSPTLPPSCISSPPSPCFPLLPPSRCFPLYSQAPHLHRSPTDVALAPWGVSKTIQTLFECIHSRACHPVPKFVPLIFPAKKQHGVQQLASVPGFYRFPLLLIEQQK